MNAVLRFCIRERLLVALFALGALAFGWYATQEVPIDAIPNVGENQVIVLTEWAGRSPRDIEDQITYPLSIALQAVPGSQSVRGKSMFGFSFVQVTFKDHVDFYWARSRVAEQLATVTGSLPDDATPTLAPDSTALGQIFYYVLEGPPGMDLATMAVLLVRLSAPPRPSIWRSSGEPMAARRAWSRPLTSAGRSRALKYGPLEVPPRIIRQGMAIWVMGRAPRWRCLITNMRAGP